jgi:hypothetical protein
VLAVLLAGGGCAPRPLLERAIRARGGAVDAVVRVSDVDVHSGFPGRWRWRTVFLPPDRYAWSVETTHDPMHYLFDGTIMRVYLGGALTAEDASPDAPLRSHARVVGVALLDVLRAPNVSVRELAREELPPECRAGLAAAFADPPAVYRVCLDDRLLVRRVDGPVDLSPIGRGTVSVRFDELRRVDGLVFARRARWLLDERLLADECVTHLCVAPPELDAASFHDPSTLPGCERPLGSRPCVVDSP